MSSRERELKRTERAMENPVLRRAREERAKKRRRAVCLLLLVLLVGAVSMGFHIASLRAQQEYYAAREAELESEIAGEEARSEELTTEQKFRLTVKYIEQVAREKLGLVYPDEILLEPDE